MSAAEAWETKTCPPEATPRMRAARLTVGP